MTRDFHYYLSSVISIQHIISYYYLIISHIIIISKRQTIVCCSYWLPTRAYCHTGSLPHCLAVLAREYEHTDCTKDFGTLDKHSDTDETLTDPRRNSRRSDASSSSSDDDITAKNSTNINSATSCRRRRISQSDIDDVDVKTTTEPQPQIPAQTAPKSRRQSNDLRDVEWGVSLENITSDGTSDGTTDCFQDDWRVSLSTGMGCVAGVFVFLQSK